MATSLALLLVALPAGADSASPAGWAEVLVQYTRAVPDTAGVRVDYGALARSDDWSAVVAALEATDLGVLVDRAARLAFWINAYNILAIDTVVRRHPIESIRDAGNFLRPVWKRTAGRIGGQPRTLDEIEHDILRPMGDPRIHAAIVCASVSCPSLRREPYLSDRIDTQLDASVREWLIARDKGLSLNRERGRVRISRIFRWFAGDFEVRGGVLAFVREYAPADDRAWLEGHPDAGIDYFEYDWSLNGLSARNDN